MSSIIYRLSKHYGVSLGRGVDTSTTMSSRSIRSLPWMTKGNQLLPTISERSASVRGQPHPACSSRSTSIVNRQLDQKPIYARDLDRFQFSFLKHSNCDSFHACASLDSLRPCWHICQFASSWEAIIHLSFQCATSGWMAGPARRTLSCLLWSICIYSENDRCPLGSNDQ